MKRFIRYLYEYEQGKRMRNVGFVKVEQGDGECIVHIHGKGLRLEGIKELELFLFFEKDGECLGVSQGIIENVNPAVNYQLYFTSQDTGEPENFGLIEGIVMKNSTDHIYAAVWDDMPVNVNNMRRWVRQDEHTSVQEETYLQDDEADQEDVEADQEDGELKQTSETEVSEETAGVLISEEDCGCASCASGEYEDATEPVCEESAAESADAADMTGAAQEQCCNAGRDMCGGQRQKKYTKIQRKDIARLPRCEWKLSNNSFLLHGYYNYHHLLFIEDGDTLWLGIPGVYHNKEAKVAETFGFPQFIRLEEGALELYEDECNNVDDFGYWCRRVRRERML